MKIPFIPGSSGNFLSFTPEQVAQHLLEGLLKTSDKAYWLSTFFESIGQVSDSHRMRELSFTLREFQKAFQQFKNGSEYL